MFVKKTDVEFAEFVKTATPEKLAAYYNDLNIHDRKALDAAIAAKATKEDIDAKVNAIEAARDLQMKALNEKLAQYGVQIAKLSEGEKTTSDKKSIKDGLIENKEKLKNMKGATKAVAKENAFSLKAASDMLISTHVTGEVPQAQRLPGLNEIASRRVRLLDIISRGRASSNVISWVYEANLDGGPAVVAEGATKPKQDFDLLVGSASLQKVAAYIRVSEEMMEDIDFIDSQIRNRLRKELLKFVENLSYTAIDAVATAFAAGTFAGTVDSANEVDVLVVAMNQIALADHDRPDYILMNPSDVTKLKLYKVSSSDRRYIDRLTMIAGQMAVDGVPIIETTLIPVTKYLVGAFDMATMYDKGEVRIEVDRNGDDFIQNMMTILAEWRGITIVENNDRTAFVKGDFDTDKAALETP